MAKREPTEISFYAYLDSIGDKALRARVEDSAFANASDMAREGAFDSTSPDFWQAAIATAEMCVDDAPGFFPELFAKTR